MVKLGFILQNTSEGKASASFEVNALHGNWVRSLPDVRSYLKELHGFDGSGHTVLLTRFLGKEGWVVAVIKSRPEGSGRAFDNTAAWVHVPANAEVKGEDLVQILKTVEQQISSQIGINKPILEQLFGKEYPIKKVQPSIIERINSQNSSEAPTGCVHYGQGTYTLAELLSDYLAQPQYNQYKGVFFMDKAAPAFFRQKDISPLRRSCIIMPPKSQDEFKAYFQETKKPFNQPIEVWEGTPIRILWNQKYYQNIEKEYKVSYRDHNNQPSGIQILPYEIKMHLYPEQFVVRGENGIPLRNYQLYVKDKIFTQAEYIPKSELTQGVMVQATSTGYEEYNSKIKITNSEQKIDIQMEAKKYTFKIPIDPNFYSKGEADATVELRTTHPLKGSPIEGYDLGQEAPKNTYKLRKKEHFAAAPLVTKLTWFAGGVLSMLVLALLIALGIEFFGGDDKGKKDGEKPAQEQKAEPKNSQKIKINSIPQKEIKPDDIANGLNISGTAKNTKTVSVNVEINNENIHTENNILVTDNNWERTVPKENLKDKEGKIVVTVESEDGKAKDSFEKAINTKEKSQDINPNDGAGDTPAPTTPSQEQGSNEEEKTDKNEPEIKIHKINDITKVEDFAVKGTAKNINKIYVVVTVKQDGNTQKETLYEGYVDVTKGNWSIPVSKENLTNKKGHITIAVAENEEEANKGNHKASENTIKINTTQQQ